MTDGDGRNIRRTLPGIPSQRRSEPPILVPIEPRFAERFLVGVAAARREQIVALDRPFDRSGVDLPTVRIEPLDRVEGRAEFQRRRRVVVPVGVSERDETAGVLEDLHALLERRDFAGNIAWFAGTDQFLERPGVTVGRNLRDRLGNVRATEPRTRFDRDLGSEAVLDALDEQFKGGIPLGIITAAMSKQGWTVGETIAALHELRMSGALWEPRDDHLRPV